MNIMFGEDAFYLKRKNKRWLYDEWDVIIVVFPADLTFGKIYGSFTKELRRETNPCRMRMYMTFKNGKWKEPDCFEVNITDDRKGNNPRRKKLFKRV